MYPIYKYRNFLYRNNFTFTKIRNVFHISKSFFIFLYPRLDLNQRPPRYKLGTLTTELRGRIGCTSGFEPPTSESQSGALPIKLRTPYKWFFSSIKEHYKYTKNFNTSQDFFYFFLVYPKGVEPLPV